MVTIYLDVCCLNRPFDDQTRERIRLESEAVLLILAQVEAGKAAWRSSEVVDYELDRMNDVERRQRVGLLMRAARNVIRLDVKKERRGTELAALGFSPIDALHLACAESARLDVFLTTDDRLLRRATRLRSSLRVRVTDPVTWIREGGAR